MWLRVLSPTELLTRIDDRLRLLSRGERSNPTWHHTLAAVDWSHRLCTAAEQRLWARLSVFDGGFTLRPVRP